MLVDKVNSLYENVCIDESGWGEGGGGTKKTELSGILSKSEKKAVVSTAIRMFLDSKLIVSEKCLNREFEAIPAWFLS